MVLNLATGVFGEAVFKNFTLNTQDFDLNKIEIYPNPTSSLIHLKSQNSPIVKIELFNSLGQSMKTIKSHFMTIDISDLSNGIYIMKIYTELGTFNKKILKK